MVPEPEVEPEVVPEPEVEPEVPEPEPEVEPEVQPEEPEVEPEVVGATVDEPDNTIQSTEVIPTGPE